MKKIKIKPIAYKDRKKGLIIMKLSIGRLLILAFSFILLVVGVVGIVGYQAMTTISRNSDVILYEKVP